MILGIRHGVWCILSQQLEYGRLRNRDLWTAAQHVPVHPRELAVVPCGEDRTGQ